MLKYYYLDVSVQSEVLELTEVFFKQHILERIQLLFGVATQSFNIDLLKFDPAALRGIIRVSADQYIKVRAALTLASDYKINIHKASPILLALQGDSREYIH